MFTSYTKVERFNIAFASLNTFKECLKIENPDNIEEVDDLLIQLRKIYAKVADIKMNENLTKGTFEVEVSVSNA